MHIRTRERMPFEPLSILMAAGPVPAETVVRLGRSIADALQAPHGELWPSAILVDGEAVRVQPPGAMDRTRWGQYAAPERILGGAATPAADVFSLAAILHHALGGRPPFAGDSPAAVMLAACRDAPRPLPPDVPQALEVILLRCLEKDPARRFATPHELGQALESYDRPSAFPGRRILVADDDAPVRELYVQVARRVGVEADIVASGRDAIEAMKTCRYDVALLDLNMPRLSGWEVLDFLRTRYDKRPRHLFIVTGFADQMISAADRELVEAVLYKPVAPEELSLLVAECLRGHAPDLPSILRRTSHRRVTAA